MLAITTRALSVTATASGSSSCSSIISRLKSSLWTVSTVALRDVPRDLVRWPIVLVVIVNDCGGVEAMASAASMLLQLLLMIAAVPIVATGRYSGGGVGEDDLSSDLTVSASATSTSTALSADGPVRFSDGCCCCSAIVTCISCASSHETTGSLICWRTDTTKKDARIRKVAKY